MCGSDTITETSLDILINECAACRENPDKACTLSLHLESLRQSLSERRHNGEEHTAVAKFPEENPNPVLRLSEDGRIIYANPAAWPVLSVWGAAVRDGAPQEVAQVARETLRTGLPRNMEIECADHVYELLFAPVVDGGYVNVYGRNLTERRRMEQQLRRVQREQQALLDNIPDIVWLKDRLCRYVTVNAACARMLGMEREDIVGKTDRDVCPLDLAERYITDDATVMRTGRRMRVDEPIEDRRTGQRLIIETIKTPVHDESGTVVGTAGIARDVTERRKLQSQLAQAQKLEAIGRLAAGIAHEINTPTQFVGDNLRFLSDSFIGICHLLGAARALVSAVKQGLPTDKVLAETEEVARRVDLDFLLTELPPAITQSLEGVRRIAKIVRAMKEFSHPGMEGKAPADINKAIDNTVTVARTEWKYVAEMVLDLDPALGPVPCHLGDLNQVFLNIIVNAAHAISDVVGGTGAKGTIRISTRADGDWAEIRISDTGTGIPPGAQGHIFDPFFTTKEVGRGTGQGLAIAHNVVVSKHGGSIDFETETGKGATFIIRLPMKFEEEAPS